MIPEDATRWPLLYLCSLHYFLICIINMDRYRVSFIVLCRYSGYVFGHIPKHFIVAYKCFILRSSRLSQCKCLFSLQWRHTKELLFCYPNIRQLTLESSIQHYMIMSYHMTFISFQHSITYVSTCSETCRKLQGRFIRPSIQPFAWNSYLFWHG